jgi:hypothetical protein
LKFFAKNCDISKFRSLVGNTVDVGGRPLSQGVCPPLLAIRNVRTNIAVGVQEMHRGATVQGCKVSRGKDVKCEDARCECLRAGGDAGGHLDAGNTDCKAAQGEQGFRGCKERSG